MSGRPTFLDEPAPGADAERVYAEDIASDGYVRNATRLWCWRPDVYEAFMALMPQVTAQSSLSRREVAVLVTVTAATRGDSYCALAWGSRLSALTDEGTAAAVVAGDDGALSERERVLAGWARRVVRDPNANTIADVERLRDAGLSEREIFEATAYVALRLALSTVNDALGASPDAELAARAPARVREAVAFGRAPA